ncbi:hypothetical protein ACF0H5_014192 [Mactra antiquata]
MTKVTKLCFGFLCMFGLLAGEISAFLSKPSTIILQNNEYRNVIVAIHDSIPEDKAFIDKLKDILTQTSKILYKATRRRAYFKEIKILVPSTWSDDPLYQAATSETISFADVILTNPIRGKRSLPQTRSYEGCGKQGIHILLTKDFVDEPRVDPYFNNPAKYLVHSFAQFRWGVFQEYPEEGEPLFYMSAYTGRPEAIRCTIMIRGLVQKNDTAQTICYLEQQAQSQGVIASVDPNTGLYDSDCLWRPYPTRQRSTASIMDHQYIQELETFCDDDPANYMTYHNFEAPSKHNRLCGHRSTWNVIKNTDDFSGGKNPSGSLTDSQLTPTFILVKSSTRKRRSVLAVDPAVLAEPTQAEYIKKSLSHYLHERLPSDTQELFILGQKKDRLHLVPARTVDDLNTVFTMDHTSGDLRLDSDTRFSIQDSHVIAITAGTTINGTMNLNSLQENNTSNKVTSISLNKNEPTTNGHGEYYIGTSLGHSLLDRIRHVMMDERSNTLIVSQTQYHLLFGQPTSDVVYIDDTLSNHVTFLIHYEDDLPFIDLKSPSGVIYGIENVVCSIDLDNKVIKFHYDFIEVGTWTITLHQASLQTQKVNVTVLSETGNSYTDPLTFRSSIKFENEAQNTMMLHIDAMQGVHPVIGLNVTAKIELPDHSVKSVKLLDNGAGTDISKDDGVYSRSFIPPNLSGPYHVTFLVSGKFGQVFKKEESFTIDTEIKKHIHRRAINSNIQRHIFGGTIHVNERESKRNQHDDVAPSRIFDLHLLKYIPYRRTLVLSWTAPGDDLDIGEAHSYEVFIGTDIKDVRQFLEYIKAGDYDRSRQIVKQVIPARKEAHKKESLLLHISRATKTYIFSIRAIDKSGNIADTSNVVIFTLAEEK